MPRYAVGPPLCSRPVEPPSRTGGREIERLASNYQPLAIEPFAFWPDPGGRITFFGGMETLVANHNDAWLWAACKSGEALGRLRQLVPGDWQRS